MGTTEQPDPAQPPTITPTSAEKSAQTMLQLDESAKLSGPSELLDRFMRRARPLHLPSDLTDAAEVRAATLELLRVRRAAATTPAEIAEDDAWVARVAAGDDTALWAEYTTRCRTNR